MALVNLPAATLTFNLVDGSGTMGSVSFNVPAATTVAAAQTAADTLRPLVQAITGCGIVGQNITFSSLETAPLGLATDYSRVERKGVFTFRTAAGKTATYQIPGIVDEIVLADGRIDEDHADVTALITALAGAPWCDSNGVDITSIVATYERFRRTTRAALPSKRTPDLDVTPGFQRARNGELTARLNDPYGDEPEPRQAPRQRSGRR